MTREDFLNKFLNSPTYKQIFVENSNKKIVDFYKTISIKDGVHQELDKMVTSVLVNDKKTPQGVKFVAERNIIDQAKKFIKQKERAREN